MSRDLPTSRSRRIARQLVALGTAAAATAAFTTFAQSASAVDGGQSRVEHAVFVQTNDLAGNAVVAYARNDDGSLNRLQTYPTGGLGGTETGAVADPLASQGGLTYDAKHGLLFAVNAGSDTFTVFRVRGGDLRRLDVIGSRGHLPTSISVSGEVVYVLNAGYDGSISGFRIKGGSHVVPIADSTRTLGLGNPATPFFLKSPSQVAITPDRSAVIVPTKTGNTLEVFPLSHDGVPAAAAVINPSTAPVPFSVVFDAAGRALVTEASGSQSSYVVNADGTLMLASRVANGQKAGCWSVVAKGYIYDSNSGSNSITGYSEDASGHLALLNDSGVTATTDAAPVDMAVSGDENYLYQQATIAGTIDIYSVNDNGSLTRVGTVTGFTPDNGSGIEGIAAS